MKKIFIILCLLIFVLGYAQKITPSDNFVPSPLITNGEIHYIGNKKSLIFHISTCKTLPHPKNRILFKSKDEAISKGFKSCGNCHP